MKQKKKERTKLNWKFAFGASRITTKNLIVIFLEVYQTNIKLRIQILTQLVNNTGLDVIDVFRRTILIQTGSEKRLKIKVVIMYI